MLPVGISVLLPLCARSSPDWVGYDIDMLHSYLGLAALANLGVEEESLEEIDPVLCISMRARRHLEALPWRRKEVQS